MRKASGRIEGNVVDLHAGRIYPGRVSWKDGRITRIEPLPGRRFSTQICPGFVDAHIHIESSMLPPSEFARWAVRHGTVATVSDPHEIANVLGVAGVDYMVRDGARTPFKFNFGAPSCVPATGFETAGAALDAATVAGLLGRPEIKYLSEVMNFPGVLGGDPALLSMIEAAKAAGKPVDGHAPGLKGAQARAYAAAGISTDHECFTLPEALGKIRAGMRILIREGSAARNFSALEPLLLSTPSSCMFCCDDLHPDLLMLRHLDEHVRRALRAGADRIEALRCACLYPVKHYKLDVGLLREGDPADFIVFSGWRSLKVHGTWIEGRRVATEGRTHLRRLRTETPNAFAVAARTEPEFRVLAPGRTPSRRVNVIEAIGGQLVTRHLRERLEVHDGVLEADPSRDVLKMAVVNRYAKAAPVAVGFVRGFGLRSGAIASSVAHDSHNIVAVGADDASLCRAVNAVIKAGGGISVVSARSERVLPLPIAGLMSDQPGDQVARRYTELDRVAKRLGSKLDAPFMTLSFMALLVIPDLKLSDRGLFSGRSWGFIPLCG